MDHSLFGCLRSTHAPAQGLHPTIAPSLLTLHDRTDHVSYLDLPSSSPHYGYPGGEDNGVFGSPDHLPQKQHLLHPHHPPGWPVPRQMPSPNTLHRVCLPLPDVPARAPELCSGGSKLCDTNPSLCTGDPTVASCLSGEYGRQSLSSEDPERRSSKGKNESSGKNRNTMLHLVWNSFPQIFFIEVIAHFSITAETGFLQQITNTDSSANEAILLYHINSLSLHI